MRHTLALAFAGLAAAVPSLDVPACPRVGTIQYSRSVPSKTSFPLTQVDLCYTKTTIDMKFTAYNETNFYFNASQGINDDIWAYEVMEAFIYKGTEDPSVYLEFEVSPNNVTYQAFIYNPSKERAEGTPFDHMFVSDPIGDGFISKTQLDRQGETWVSDVKIPLAMFNVCEGRARGTKWRMNFFRTVTGPETFPEQELGAWSVPDKASFHISKFFGNVRFV